MRDSLRLYQCPSCFAAFHAGRDDGNEVECAPQCGHRFTLGEARRGRPDPDPTLLDRIAALEARLNALDAELRALRSEPRSIR